VALFVEAKVKR